MDEVVGAAQQAKVLRVLQGEQVGQWRGFDNVATGDDEALFLIDAGFFRDSQSAQRAPQVARSGAPAGHLAGFGAAVDFHQRATERSLGLRRELRRQRRGGREQQVGRRQSHARQQQGLQMKGRADQRAWPRHGSQCCADVGRVKRPPGVEGRAAQHRQQHAAFQAVAVLRRHGGHDGQASELVAAEKLGQPIGLGADVGHQRAKALGVRLRRAGGARGEQAHRQQVGSNERHAARRRHIGGALHSNVRQTGGWQRIVVAQQIGRRAIERHLAQCFGQCVGRQQAGLPAQQRRGQAQSEVVAVVAQVDGPAVRGQLLGQGQRLGNELAGADSLAMAPGQRRRQVGRGQQA